MSAVRNPPKARPLPATSRRWRKRWVIPVLVVLLVAIGFFVIRPFWRLSSQFDDITYRQPSRLYARSVVIQTGRSYPAEALVESLRNEGYRAADKGSLPAGRYRKTKGGLAVHLRSFLLPDGPHGGVVEVAYSGSRISRLRLDGETVKSVPLEPALIGSYFGADLQERRPLSVDHVATDLIDAVVAAEDDSFFEHSGVSFTGILRAFWVNLRGGEIRQGGSTLTQQLVKNLYLSHERTFGRKAQELILALLLEARYDKRQILEAYLNQIYLGGSGGVSLMGMGAASRAYFGKDPSQLDLAEAATLAGMIRAPAVYSPFSHPEKAKERRDWVLGRMAKLGRVPAARIEAALAEPVERRARAGGAPPRPLLRRRHGGRGAAPLRRRGAGRQRVHPLLHPRPAGPEGGGGSAGVGTEAGGEGVPERPERHQGAAPGRAGLARLRTTGGILAYVGGRSYDSSQFDRAGQALRQAGSAFKPIVYAAAFENDVASPASFLEDSPLTVKLATMSWSPKNDDGSFHGWVSVRTALEKSYNPATTRLALQVGMTKIVDAGPPHGDHRGHGALPLGRPGGGRGDAGRARGRSTRPWPRGGVRPPVHGLVAILDRSGKAVQGAPLPKPERVLSAQTAYMVTSLLQGVLVRGTAAGPPPGHPRRRGRQDRHHQQAPRQLVRRLRPRAGDGGLGGLRRQRDHPPLRRPRRPAPSGCASWRRRRRAAATPPSSSRRGSPPRSSTPRPASSPPSSAPASSPRCSAKARSPPTSATATRAGWTRRQCRRCAPATGKRSAPPMRRRAPRARTSPPASATLSAAGCAGCSAMKAATTGSRKSASRRGRPLRLGV